MNFKNWLQRLVKEKGLENEVFTVGWQGQFHVVEMGYLIDFLSGLERDNRDRVKDTLVWIDYKNGSVMHFLNYCAEGYIKHVYAAEL